MSFILEALRKAESSRENQTATLPTEVSLGNIAQPPAAAKPPILKTGLIAGALTIAAVIVFLSAGRQSTLPVVAAPAIQPRPAIATNASVPRPDPGTAGDREIRSLHQEAQKGEPAPAPVGADTPRDSVSAKRAPLELKYSARLSTGTRNTQPLPSYDDIVLSGRIQLPEFHLDIHVYAADAKRRFVFVNNRKYREGQELEEGGTVEEITPEGVILNYRGHRFEVVPD